MKTSAKALLILLSSSALVQSKVYLNEKFDDAEWKDRWVVSEAKPAAEIGEWTQTPGKWYADANDLAIKTGQDARFYMMSRKLDEPLDNEGKDLAIQYVVRNEQDIDCGGSYIKLMGSALDQSSFQGDSAYKIMFGPDICGPTKKTHAILNFQRPIGDTAAKNMDHSENLPVETDVQSHLYSFIIKKDNTYQFKIDGVEKKAGELKKGWEFQPPKQIKDPAQSKPADWVDEKKIPDPSDKKPEGWDDIPATIPDPEAKMPEDWDEEDDGEWEAPVIDNPEYKGEWEPRMIDNPDYKGEWVHPLIDNPDYFEDDKMYARCNTCDYVGFELWQVKAGTLLDDIFVSDDLAEALEHEKTVLTKLEAEKAAKTKMDEEAAAEKSKAEEAAKEAEEDEEEEEEEEPTERDEL